MTASALLVDFFGQWLALAVRDILCLVPLLFRSLLRQQSLFPAAPANISDSDAGNLALKAYQLVFVYKADYEKHDCRKLGGGFD